MSNVPVDMNRLKNILVQSSYRNPIKHFTLHKSYYYKLSEEGTNNSYPSLYVDKENQLWIGWVGNKKSRDDIYVGRYFPEGLSSHEEIRPITIYGKDRFSLPQRVSSQPGVNIKPSFCSDFSGKIWVIWTGKRKGKWRVLGTYFEKGKFSEEVIISEEKDSGFWPVVAKDSQKKMWCIWESCQEKEQGIKARFWDGKKWSEPLFISQESGFSFRPAIATDSAKRTYVVWDSFQEEFYSVYMRYYEEGKWSGIEEIPGKRSLDRSHPSITIDQEDNLWITYAKLKSMVDISCAHLGIAHAGSPDLKPSIHIVCWQKNKWVNSVSLEGKREGLISEEGYLPLISSDRFGRICLFWQKLTKHMDWTLQGRIYQGNDWSSLWEFEKVRQFDQWAAVKNDLEGNIWLVCESGRAFEDRHIYLRFIPAIIPEEEVDILQKKRLRYVKPKLVDISQEIIKIEPKSKEIFPIFPKKTIQTKEGECKLFWGNLHVQTILSDGHCGSVDQYYLFARERYHWDFAAVTDHCDSVKWLSSEWALLQRTASLINEPEKFIAISGYEWTQGDYGRIKYGHRCIIYPTDDQPFFSALTRKAYTQAQLSNLLKGTNGLMSAHHLTRSWNGGTRWDEWDENVEPCIEICSHWGRFEYYHNFGHITAGKEVRGCSVQDVLAKGYRVGFIGGSDSHDFCHEKNDALTLMYLKELTREDVFKALKEKRVYASTGIRIFVDFRADNHLMGEEYKAKLLLFQYRWKEPRS
ncbi:DUF3604 domain-containing protein [Candidatus Aerophobetes bacterium]|uniref:DUF3604 domain-containing protein n=1 Tax=Aerophobetes bacterium TaxID=2030807 RepID=A0A523RN65_UNCAE|nr:MAG: DUF3604 domain-containing protein [Candidatus Aerophobetes bacterium]